MVSDTGCCSNKNELNSKKTYILCDIHIIHICTAVVDESEE